MTGFYNFFSDSFRNLNLSDYINRMGISAFIFLLLSGVFLLAIIFFFISGARKKGKIKRKDKKGRKTNNHKVNNRKTNNRKTKTGADKSSEESRPSMEVLEKITRVDHHIPLNEPMQIQVMISGIKAANEFLFYLPVPSGTKKIGIKKLLTVNGKTWIRNLRFDDAVIHRDRKTGNLMVNDGQIKWRVWHPLQDIQKNGKIGQQDWVLQFRLIMRK